jgi:hypothetical protein
LFLDELFDKPLLSLSLIAWRRSKFQAYRRD